MSQARVQTLEKKTARLEQELAERARQMSEALERARHEGASVVCGFILMGQAIRMFQFDQWLARLPARPETEFKMTQDLYDRIFNSDDDEI